MDNKTLNDFSDVLQKDRHQIKCIMLGSSGSGKSSLIRRYIHDDFILNMDASIGASFSSKYVKTDYGIIKLDLWDTAGQERFDSIIPLYYKNTDIVMIVYDTTSRATFKKAKHWIVRIKKEVRKEPLFVLIGNKIDIDNHIFVEDVKKYTIDNNISFFECSAKTGQNVQNLFNSTCYDFIKQHFEKCNNVLKIEEINNTIKLENTLIVDKMNYLSLCMNLIRHPLNHVGIFKT